MRAKAKKAPMCSVSLIAIELKGLAASAEALKIICNKKSQDVWELPGLQSCNHRPALRSVHLLARSEPTMPGLNLDPHTRRSRAFAAVEQQEFVPADVRGS